MIKPLTIRTYDWVPEGKSGPRGHVRDIRLRWACEEAGLNYVVQSVPFKDRGPEHFSCQPFGQVPFLEDDGITMFESGAGLLYLAKKSEKLMPRDFKGEAETLQWTIAALNSVEMVTVPWWFIEISNVANNPLQGWMLQRLKHLEAVLLEREWLAAGRFTVADIMMSDALRVPKVRAAGDFPAIRSYIERACSRPAFKKAYDGQMSYFANIATIKEVYSAINRGDTSAALEYFHPQIERTEPEGFPAAGTFRGFSEMKAHLSQARSTWAEGACEPEHFIAAGDKIIALLHVQVRLKHKTDWIEGRIADAFAFQNGKIIQMRTFVEKNQALEWAGAQGSTTNPN